MSNESRGRVRAYVLIFVGLLFVFAFNMVGEHYYGEWALDLGHDNQPAPLYLTFVSMWLVFGLAATMALTAGASILLARDSNPQPPILERGSDRAWLVVGSVLAFAIPALIRAVVLEGAPLTDDETCYRFSAELLANFQLTTESPPHKLFFDHVFMINDGRMHSQYFLGWPALMVPGLWLGVEGYMNAVYAALTIAPIYWIAKRFAGNTAARLAIIVILCSPMLMIGAATMMSHTSCLFAISWAVWLAVRASDKDARWWHHSLIAVFFCIAFFNRPLTAVAISAPAILLWLRATIRATDTRKRLIAFLVPSGFFAALFLLVNSIQNGSPLTVSYAAAFDYARSNQWRFTHWSDETRMSVSFFDTALYGAGLAENGLAFFRFNASAFGWPASLLLLPLGLFVANVRWIFWIFPTFLALHITIGNVGIDSFGPVHFMELALPVVLLSVVGVGKLSESLSALPATIARFHRAPVIAVIVMSMLSLVSFMPQRLSAVDTISDRINKSLHAPKSAGLQNVIIFTASTINYCDAPKAPRGFVHRRPNNDINHTASILWANHLTVELDKILMKAYPERTGYLLLWKGPECEAVLVPLEEAAGVLPGVPSSYDLSDA